MQDLDAFLARIMPPQPFFLAVHRVALMANLNAIQAASSAPTDAQGTTA